eukprot:15350395-Heterocapsa_arctica.AAC.1
MSKPIRINHPGGCDGGGTIDQELNAASANTRSKMVGLCLVDTGCARDLVRAADVSRSGDKLRRLDDNVNFQTANGGTISTHSAPMEIEELDKHINPYVLKETPAVLSVGDRTMNK